jgi:erythromycin esterase-like protein
MSIITPAVKPATDSRSLGQLVASQAHPITGADSDYDPLLELIGDARFVFLGEGSHGTHEFYHERARITERLISEKNFMAVAVEADWPDAYQVNRYVRNTEANLAGHSAREALSGFQRFPAWMWRNTDVVDFVQWLRRYNDRQPQAIPGIGFYGLDLYSLFTSIDETLRYLDKVDPAEAQIARRRYACFDHYERNSHNYAYAVGFRHSASCEEAVLAQLCDLIVRGAGYLRKDGQNAADDLFYAQQNARLVMHAEKYYRTMYQGHVSSWNCRDSHMAETLEALSVHLSEQHRTPAKIVIWAHNSHIGDARATEMGQRGEFNLGQLAREKYGKDAVLIGLTTHQGTVTAASDWDAVAERKRVLPALPGSYEELFHHAGLANFMLPLTKKNLVTEALSNRRLERAIGVIYRPETERQSHYFYSSLAQQFDAVIHLENTRAVEPLEVSGIWTSGEAPETFPVGV